MRKFAIVEMVTFMKRYINLYEITMKVMDVIMWILILILITQRINERIVLIRKFRGKREVNICASLYMYKYIVINIIVIGNISV
jgi:hypothetical protein